MKINIRITLLLLFFNQATTAQLLRFNSSGNVCDAIRTFLYSPEVTRNYQNENKHDSLLFIVDLTHAFDSCQISEWRGKKIKIVNKGPLYDSLTKFRLHFVTAGRTNIYSFYANKVSKDKGSFMIQYGRNNVLSLVEFRKEKDKYLLGKIENGVE